MPKELDFSKLTKAQLLNFANLNLAIPSDGADLETTILKCHLVVEEIIRTLIDENMNDAEAVQKARLNCSQAIYVANALLAGRGESWLWDAAQKLNTIRNQMAHNLDVTGIHDRLRDFVLFINKNHYGSDIKEDNLKDEFRIAALLLLCLFFEMSKTKFELHRIK